MSEARCLVKGRLGVPTRSRRPVRTFTTVGYGAPPVLSLPSAGTVRPSLGTEARLVLGDPVFCSWKRWPPAAGRVPVPHGLALRGARLRVACVRAAFPSVQVCPPPAGRGSARGVRAAGEPGQRAGPGPAGSSRAVWLPLGVWLVTPAGWCGCGRWGAALGCFCGRRGVAGPLGRGRWGAGAWLRPWGVAGGGC